MRFAAKTGTTNDFRDNLTVGFTPNLAVAVWVGNADQTPMRNGSGIVGAAPIFLTRAVAARRPLSAARPAASLFL